MTAAPHELVLIGGGHAHVQVLRRIARRPIAGSRVTVVLDRPIAVYSGMVPGFVAGQYERAELEIDAARLAQRAGATVVLAAAIGVDARDRRIALEGRAPLAYDTASFDVGSLVAGLDVPGVRELAIATRPIGRFVDEIAGLVARARAAGDGYRVVVVGAGAAGVEVALGVRGRLARESARAARVALVDANARVLPAMGVRVAARAERALQRRDVTLHLGAGVAGAEPNALLLTDGQRLPFDALLWSAGAASQPLFAASGLATDAAGFVRIRSTLQLAAHDDLFAVGDCARFEPDLPKSGVYAVRQGPILDHNLRAHIRGRALRAYRPQRDFLVLLNLGDGTALGAKWGRAFEGRLIFAAKDAIDRRFVRRFQTFDAHP